MSGSSDEQPRLIAKRGADEERSSVEAVAKRRATGVERLPSAQMYGRSYMHRDTVEYVEVTQTGFVLTMSIDGHVKFWKKREKGIEFVKDFRAHVRGIGAYAVSHDGQLFATRSIDASDKTIKIFDVVNFDMIGIITTEFVPGALCWAEDPLDQSVCIAVADGEKAQVITYSPYASEEPRRIIDTAHRQPVAVMAYTPVLECMVTADQGGMVEYWRLDTPQKLPQTVDFTLKSQTDLYEFKKSKSVPYTLRFSQDFEQFVSTSSDSCVRVFRAATGKLIRKYDESVEASNAIQLNDSSGKFKLDEMEFGRRLAVENELAKSRTKGAGNAVFDDSGRFVVFGSLVGIKIVDIANNRVVRVLGKPEPYRFVHVALSQATPDAAQRRLQQQAGDRKHSDEDPTVFSTAFRRNRFFMFTHEEPDHTGQSDRDVFNERPTREEASLAVEPTTGEQATGAVLRTTAGDIHIALFPEHAPKAVENFVGLVRQGYYNNVIFHRVIKGFMIQTGDPLGDGTGGESIWKRPFADEFTPQLRHDRPFTLSMANAGKDTNGSQFFITTIDAAPWLDDKHTVFGRVTAGADVVRQIEQAKTDKHDKPLEEISIMNIQIKTN
ncbi:Peptidyl-prolyl cis-trans isomerase cyp15 [Coemansia brasiliensis]|uniref:peptidylprolyl isomerase n=1 Tax=Coemansia brasiliensis TaxID=2650707 RepID=A0A9W8M113_9FUNG|nr:Peptidyl-prolyl cis-trans isomerase cyp15 [Coemansia brasiliensis]